MKLAFISDIHANLPALEAVWQDIQQYQPDDIFCLGDLVNFAGWDNEVIDFMRKQNITSLQGNHDEGIGYGYKQFQYSFKTKEQNEFGIASIAYVNEHIEPGNRKFLKSLPFSINLEFHFQFHNIRLALAHGSPVSNNEYVLPDTSEGRLLELLNEINADILIAGHTHKPFHKAVFCEEENNKLYRHFINAGSVGKPKHGDNKACYVMIDIDENLQLNDPGSVQVQFRYIPYEAQKVITKIHELGLGNAYDEFLLKGEP
jgi:putative phosphoesterase